MADIIEFPNQPRTRKETDAERALDALVTLLAAKVGPGATKEKVRTRVLEALARLHGEPKSE